MPEVAEKNGMGDMNQATPTENDRALRYEQLLGQVLKTAPQVGQVLERAHENRLRELNRYLNDDALREHFPGSYFVGLEEVFSVLDAITAAFQRSPVLKDIAFLTARARADFQSAIDAALGGFNGVVLDTMRDVMEVEYLLRDFQHDKQRIGAWLHADRDTLLNEFSPNKLRKRHAKALDTVPEKLPDALEYRIHSEGLHVSPSFILSDLAGKGFTQVPGQRGAEYCFAEMFEHARRVFLAAYGLGVTIEGSAWTGPDVRTGMPEAARAWERTRAVMAAIVQLERASQTDDSNAGGGHDSR